jgi:hypothetical protein
MSEKNPTQKLFRYLTEDAQSGDIEAIHKYTGQTTSDILGRGCEMSEVVNRCLDLEDSLSFEEAFDPFNEIK